MKKILLPTLFTSLAFAGCATTESKPEAETNAKATGTTEKQAMHDDTETKYAPDAPKAEHGKHHGEHGHHRFDDPEKWAKRFENPERDQWQKPDEVIAKLNLKSASKVADIGSATGYFDVRIAKIIPEGKMWSVDLEETMVAYLNKRAQTEGLTNLKSIQGEPADPKIPEAVDVILVVNTYHHIADRSAYFQKLNAKLLPKGRIAIVDFKTGDLPFGPPAKMKLAPEQVIAEMKEAGFVVDTNEQELLPHQYLLIFKTAEQKTE